MIEVAPAQHAERVVTRENQILFCSNTECVDILDKIYSTFLKVFVIEIIVGGLSLVTIREEISIEKRVEEQSLTNFFCNYFFQSVVLILLVLYVTIMLGNVN